MPGLLRRSFSRNVKISLALITAIIYFVFIVLELMVATAMAFPLVYDRVFLKTRVMQAAE
jgi:hypothetical protein